MYVLRENAVPFVDLFYSFFRLNHGAPKTVLQITSNGKSCPPCLDNQLKLYLMYRMLYTISMHTAFDAVFAYRFL